MKTKTWGQGFSVGCLPIILTFEERWFLKCYTCIRKGCGVLPFSSFPVSCFNNGFDVLSLWLLEAPLAAGSRDDVTSMSNCCNWAKCRTILCFFTLKHYGMAKHAKACIYPLKYLSITSSVENGPIHSQ